MPSAGVVGLADVGVVDLEARNGRERTGHWLCEAQSFDESRKQSTSEMARYDEQ